MGTSYRSAPDVRKIADKLITQHHQHLLGEADRIIYLFRSEAARSKGRVVLGKARLLSGLNAWLYDAGVDGPAADGLEGAECARFVMEIAHDEWRELNAAGRKALVDHELCHFWIETDEETGDQKLMIRGHDLEEFVEVVARHGCWRPEVEHVVKVGAEQLKLL